MARISRLSRQLIITQANPGNFVSGLLPTIQSVYEFLLEEDTLINLNTRKDTLAHIAQTVSRCAQFIKDYSETKSFCMPLGLLHLHVLTRYHLRDATWEERYIGDADSRQRLRQNVRRVDATISRSRNS